jgi:Eco57I restriction-modification methylase
MTTQFSDLSIDITNKLAKETKKNEGIYFTPKTIINRIMNTFVNYVDTNGVNIERILEPSCGSCEFVRALDDLFEDVVIDCYETNPIIYDNIKDLSFVSNQVNVYNQDFLKVDASGAACYDLIIGNPPYFVIKRTLVPQEYDKYVCGRPNIFTLFIIHSLQLLRAGGILMFVVPKSFLNSYYYSEVRNYIKQTCKIIELQDYESNNDFIDTEQATFGLILQKLDNELESVLDCEPCPYSLRINGDFIFTPDAEMLSTYFEGATTLKELGIEVKTGTIVWNEKKDLLTDSEDATLLLYNTNVTKDNKLVLTEFKNASKFQRINAEGQVEPMIVVNRGNGNSKYVFKYTLVDLKEPYLVENHLNMVYTQLALSPADKIKLYEKVIESFKDPRTTEFIQLYFGNGGMSKTELESVLPIY